MEVKSFCFSFTFRLSFSEKQKQDFLFFSLKSSKNEGGFLPLQIGLRVQTLSFPCRLSGSPDPPRLLRVGEGGKVHVGISLQTLRAGN